MISFLNLKGDIARAGAVWGISPRVIINMFLGGQFSADDNRALSPVPKCSTDKFSPQLCNVLFLCFD